MCPEPRLLAPDLQRDHLALVGSDVLLECDRLPLEQLWLRFDQAQDPFVDQARHVRAQQAARVRVGQDDEREAARGDQLEHGDLPVRPATVGDRSLASEVAEHPGEPDSLRHVAHLDLGRAHTGHRVRAE